MLKIYSCIAYAHDLKLVALAAAICVLASFAAINLLHHARKSSGYMQGLWLAVSAVSTGFGIWATHFVAMLAFTGSRFPVSSARGLRPVSQMRWRAAGCCPPDCQWKP